MTTEKTFDPGHPLVADYGRDGVTGIAVSLGARPAGARHLKGSGVPCVIYPITARGTLGAGAHPGFVDEFPVAELESAGFDRDAIYRALGARTADVLDPTDGSACCRDCYAAAFTGTAKPAPEPHGVCVSCAQMLDESLADAERAAGEE